MRRFDFSVHPATFLVGLDGRTGLWIDQITAFCAQWKRDQSKTEFPNRVGLFGGGGGGPTTVLCPSNSAISGWTIHQTRATPPMVEFVWPKCRTILPPNAVVDAGDLKFGEFHPPEQSLFSHPFGAAEVVRDCPKFELAIGLHGASGSHVDRLGLICGPVPPIRVRSATGKCLDVHAPDQLKNGGRVQVWDCNNQDQQDWRVIDRALVTKKGKCLDVHAPDQNKNGGRVQIWDCNGSPQQQWSMPDGKSLRSAAGKCLDVNAPDQGVNGGRVQVWDCNGSQQQRWLVRG